MNFHSLNFQKLFLELYFSVYCFLFLLSLCWDVHFWYVLMLIYTHLVYWLLSPRLWDVLLTENGFIFIASPTIPFISVAVIGEFGHSTSEPRTHSLCGWLELRYFGTWGNCVTDNTVCGVPTIWLLLQTKMIMTSELMGLSQAPLMWLLLFVRVSDTGQTNSGEWSP